MIDLIYKTGYTECVLHSLTKNRYTLNRYVFPNNFGFSEFKKNEIRT